MTLEDIDSAPTDVKKFDNHENNIEKPEDEKVPSVVCSDTVQQLTEKEETPTVTESENNNDKPLGPVDSSNINRNLLVGIKSEKTKPDDSQLDKCADDVNADVDNVSEQKALPSNADVDKVSEQKALPSNADVDITSESGIKTDDATEDGSAKDESTVDAGALQVNPEEEGDNAKTTAGAESDEAGEEIPATAQASAPTSERGFSGFDLNEDVSSDEADPGLNPISIVSASRPLMGSLGTSAFRQILEPEKSLFSTSLEQNDSNQRLKFDLNVSDGSDNEADKLPLDLNSPQSSSFRNFDLNSHNDDVVPFMGKLLRKQNESVISIFGTQVGVNRNDPSTDFSLGQSGLGKGGFDLNGGLGSILGGKRLEPDGGFEGSAVNYKRQQQ